MATLTPKTTMETTSKLFLTFLFCFALFLVSGCGGGVSLTPAEQAEVDKYVAGYGRGAIVHYLRDSSRDANTDQNLVLKYIKYFVSQGADVKAKDDYGTTPLHIAAGEKNSELVKFLVSKGADVHAKNNDGITPLHFAENLDVARLFVSKGADVNAKDDKYGATPLHIAVAAGNIEIIEFLVSKGADINAKDKDGETPRDRALLSGNNDIRPFL